MVHALHHTSTVIGDATLVSKSGPIRANNAAPNIWSQPHRALGTFCTGPCALIAIPDSASGFNLRRHDRHRGGRPWPGHLTHSNYTSVILLLGDYSDGEKRGCPQPPSQSGCLIAFLRCGGSRKTRVAHRRMKIERVYLDCIGGWGVRRGIRRSAIQMQYAMYTGRVNWPPLLSFFFKIYIWA
jgi:hypothetical protein